MADADAFAPFATMVLVAEGDDALPVLKPDCARSSQARRVEAPGVRRRASGSPASVPRFGMQLRLRLARHLCGIMIPHARLIDIGSASQGALRMFVNAFDVTGRRAADRVEGRDGRRTARPPERDGLSNSDWPVKE